MTNVKDFIKTLTIIGLIIIGFATVFTVVNPDFANAQAASEQLCEGSGGTWNGESCVSGDGEVDIASLVTRIINVLLFIVGAASVIMIIIGGIRYVVSGGDQNAVAGAKNTILYAVVGLVVAFAAYALVNFVLNGLQGILGGGNTGASLLAAYLG